ELQKFELDENEWEIARQLCDILKVLKDATLFFSRSTPDLATVIPAMDLIDERLTTYSHDTKFLLSIHSAVGLAKKTLDRYYQLMDKSEVYRIAMVLHPHHKLSYFKSAGWEDGWIKIAEDLIRNEFEQSSLNMEIRDDADSKVEANVPPAVDISCLVYYLSLSFLSL
ncbi:hypothetical protein EV702DRAFT_959578, partial [Suillus placidus]